MEYTQTILSTSYLPPIQYFQAIHDYDNTYIEHKEYHKRHSIRNRTLILGANNTLFLTVPIVKKHYSKTLIENIKIAKIKWKHQHINSIQNAYGSSPFFIYYFEEIKKIINKNHIFLIDLNNDFLDYFLRQLKLDKKPNKTKYYIKDYSDNITDQRDSIKIKKKLKKYHQVFSDTFIPNLSIIDLIFNLGPNAREYITS